MCRRLSAVLAALPLLVLAGCGADAESEPAGAPDTGNSGDTGAVVEHQFGETRVDGVPERVVALDRQWTDVMLAFGVTPVGYASQPTDDGTLPWQELDGAEPLDVSDGPSIEQVAALEPDLILGSYLISETSVYDRLSGIAPTVPLIDGRDVTPWRDLVTLGGELLGEPERAAELIAEVDAEVAAAGAELGGLQGKSFALAQYIVGDAMYIVADPEDGSSELFTTLGMELFEPVRAEGERTGDARVQVSTERADLLGADLVAFLINGGDESDLADIPGFEDLAGTVAVLDFATIVGLNTPSPLSIPYALEELTPYLQEAAG